MWQAGAQLLAGRLRRTLDAATAALERGKARGDEDDSAFAEVNSALSAAIAVVKQWCWHAARTPPVSLLWQPAMPVHRV
jgi:hypothetical protein